MKLKKSVIFIVTILFIFTGCGSATKEKNNATAYEKIQEKLTTLQTYQSEATVEYKSNKGSSVYDTIHKCTVDGKYRVEVVGPERVAGNITLSDGQVIYQFNSKIDGKVSVGVTENQERSEIFVTSFLKNYLTSQEVSVSVGNFGEGNCTVLEATIPGNHPYLATEKLWVDNKTFNPIKLVIYDEDGSERIIITFKTFEYNIELDEKLFTL